MLGLHQNEDSPEKVLVQDVVLDVVSVVLDKEGKELEDEALQLNGAVVVLLRPVAGCVGQKGTCNRKVQPRDCDPGFDSCNLRTFIK